MGWAWVEKAAARRPWEALRRANLLLRLEQLAVPENQVPVA